MRFEANLYLATVCLLFIKGGVSGSSSGLPRVWWVPGNTAVEGDTIELQCQIASNEFGPAIWLKLDPEDPNNHVLLSHGEMIITEDQRFSASHRTHDNTYVLKIEEVSLRDAGSYQCQVPVTSQEEELRVEAAPPVVVTLLSDKGHNTSSKPLHPSVSALCSIILLLLWLVR